MNVQAAIAQFRAAQLSNEAAIAAVNPATFVIMWHGAALKTDGKRVGLCGTKVYTGSRAFMLAEATKFTKVALDKLEEGMEVVPATVHTAAEALAIMKAANAELLAKVEAANV